MTLFYVPLESYRERYTMQLSAPKTGWLERNWIKAGIPYHRVEGARSAVPRTIRIGCVLDAVGRSLFCFSQVEELLRLAEAGELTSDDIIYFDDFWTPGIEVLPYAFSLLNIKPKVYAFLYAQSVDEFDFTYSMRSWMRHFEKGIGEFLDGIFVCGPCLQDLVVFGGIASREKVHVTGLIFDSEEVRERMPKGKTLRLDQVVYSSRWDREKNPWFFLKVAEKVLAERPQAKFVVCTSSPTIRSNDPKLLGLLWKAVDRYSGRIVVKQNLTKEEYYAELCQSKIQMNTADQDFVAFTLLESSVAGCYPIYPYFRSFPETFLHRPGFMYERLDVKDAAKKVIGVLDQDDLWNEKAIQLRAWIHERFDSSWLRMLNVMGLSDTVVADPHQ